MQDFSTFLYLINDYQYNLDTAMDIENIDIVVANMDFEPSEQSMNNILDFANSYEVLETETTGFVEMNLN